MNDRFSTGIGKAIRRRRVDLEMSGTTLAQAIGTSQAYMCRIETGKRVPCWQTVRRIAEALSMPAEVLMWDAITVDLILPPKDRETVELASILLEHYKYARNVELEMREKTLYEILGAEEEGKKNGRSGSGILGEGTESRDAVFVLRAEGPSVPEGDHVEHGTRPVADPQES